MSDDNTQTGNLPSQEDVFLGKSKTPLKSSDTEQILARMQQIVDERSGALNTFQSGWKDASAWFSGGVNGPTAGLAIRDRQKQLESQDTMKMMREMADIRAAEAEAKRYAESQANDYSPIGGGSASAGAATGIPGVTSQNGQYLFRGKIPLSEEEYALARSYRNEADRTKFLESLVKQRSEGRIKWENDPNVYKEEQFTLDGRIRDLDLKTRRQIFAEAGKRGVSPLEVAREYFRHLEGGTSAGQPGATSPRLGTQAIAQVETGGREGLVSPKGAMGVMQVMPNTNRDPGFGVTPARDSSQAELKRVGEDYFAAMQKKYGNDTLAAIAYNMGPGDADRWLKKGGEFSALPKETQNYIGKVHLAQAQLSKQPEAGLSAAPVEVAVQSTAQPVTARSTTQPNRPISQMSSTEIKEAMKREEEAFKTDLAIKQARGTSEMTEVGKATGQERMQFEQAGGDAKSQIASAEYINKMIDTAPTVFGVIQHADISSAILSAVQKGMATGVVNVAIPGITDLIRKALPGATDVEIDAAQKAAQQLAKMKLTHGRQLLKGSGAISDFEQGLVNDFIGSIDNSPGALKDFMAWTKMRAEFDLKANKLWQQYKENNRGKNVSFEDFKLDSKEYDRIKNEYDDKIHVFGKQGGLNYQAPKANAPKPMTYSDSNKENRYQEWLRKQAKGQ